jgi:hypothetical protein
MKMEPLLYRSKAGSIKLLMQVDTALTVTKSSPNAYTSPAMVGRVLIVSVLNRSGAIQRMVPARPLAVAVRPVVASSTIVNPKSVIRAFPFALTSILT